MRDQGLEPSAFWYEEIEYESEEKAGSWDCKTVGLKDYIPYIPAVFDFRNNAEAIEYFKRKKNPRKIAIRF